MGSSSTARSVVVLGASHAGLQVAHKLLKNTLPKSSTPFTVTLVAPTTHLYWNVAAVRAVVPGLLADNVILKPFLPAFERYPKGCFSFINGTASKLDAAAKTVVVTTNAGEEQTLTYDICVIATGSRSAQNLPYKTLGSYEKTVQELHNLQQKVKAARSIVIGGAGPTGTEMAAELGDEYTKNGAKEITLVSGSRHLIPSTKREDIGRGAEDVLTKMGVKVIHETRVKKDEPVGSQTKLTLSNGETLLVDLYIPTTGVLPNTDFVPGALLDDGKSVNVDAYLRVVGTSDLYAIGDAANAERKQIVYADMQAGHVAKSLDGVLTGGAAPTEYKKVKMEAIGVTLGRNKATGVMNGWRVPGMLIWWMKGRTMMAEHMDGIVEGKKSTMGGTW